MILDRLENAERYFGLHPLFEKSFRFLRESVAQAAEGREAIDGERAYVIVSRRPGTGEAGAKLESHRKYIDIQYCIDGKDRIGWKPSAECAVATPYDADRDLAFYSDASESWFDVPAGTFAIFFPEDGHAPLAGHGEVRKAIVKIAVSESSG